MSTDHRKPLVAFVLLALAAAVLVGVGRAHAEAGRLFEAAGARTVHVQGVVPTLRPAARESVSPSGLGPAFDALAADEEPTAVPSVRVGQLRDPKTKHARRTDSVSRDAARRPVGASRDEAAAHGHRDARRYASDARTGGRAEHPGHEALERAVKSGKALDKAQRRAAWPALAELRHSVQVGSKVLRVR